MKPRWWIVSAIQDTRLSADARALLIFLGTRPGGWRYSVEECRRYMRFGRNKHFETMNALVALGYVVREQQRSKAGKLLNTIVRLADTLPSVSPKQGHGKGSPSADLQDSGPCPENRDSRARIMRAGAPFSTKGSTSDPFRLIVGGRDA